MSMAATSDADVPIDEEFTLLSNDKKPFVVSRGLLRQSTLISNLFRDLGLDGTGTSPTIPLNNVSGSVLEKVVEWAKLHKNDKDDNDDDVEMDCTEHSSESSDSDATDYSSEATYTVSSNSGVSDAIDARDEQFLSNVDQPMLFDLILAANYMDIKPLLMSTTKAVANMIQGKTCEELRLDFNIENDLDKDEEEQIKRENVWCEESVKKVPF